MKLLLGSASPRRRELLQGLDIDFQTVRIGCEEHYPAHLQGEAIPLFLAKLKAEAYDGQLQKDEVLLTADTIVWLNNRVYGKPHDEQDARRMLGELSGQTHEVLTGVCLSCRTESGDILRRQFAACSRVSFRELTADEIAYYVQRYRPLDKAGAYGVQEWIGYVGVKGIEGSYYNVMGLPVQRVYEELQAFAPQLLQRL